MIGEIHVLISGSTYVQFPKYKSLVKCKKNKKSSAKLQDVQKIEKKQEVQGFTPESTHVKFREVH
jgi:hypothetical protein